MSLIRNVERSLASQNALRALNAFISLAQDSSLSSETFAVTENNVTKSAVSGRLIAIKDNICTLDRKTSCASEVLRGFDSPLVATVDEKLRAAGALIAGTTNLDEFGMGSHSTNSCYGPVRNGAGSSAEPLSAGGSSGGSAVAVATQQCYAAIGTDTGGSIRLPAAYNGVTGFKPSYGMVSRYGVVAYANSLDTVGVLARSSEDAKQVFGVIRGYDGRDPTSLLPATRARISEQLSVRPKRDRLRIGVPIEYNTKELDSSIRTAWIETLSRLKGQGHQIFPVSLPTTSLALSAYYVIAPAEASSNLAKYDAVRYGNQATDADRKGVLYSSTRGQNLGQEVKRRILLGGYSLSAAAIDNYFIQAQKVRRLVQRDFDRAFALSNPLSRREQTATKSGHEGVDVLISPTATTMPPRLSELASRSPVDTYGDDVLTVPVNLAGLPALSVPVPLSEDREGPSPGLAGLQIVAQFGDDDMVFRAAQDVERAFGN